MKGGNRLNAGRKKINSPRVTLSVRIKKETKDTLVKCAKEEDTSVGRIIDKLTETV